MKSKASHYINHCWIQGQGKPLLSKNPYNDEVLWQGQHATAEEVTQAVSAAHNAFPQWERTALEKRIEYLKHYQSKLEENRSELSETLSKETGKPSWEAKGEVETMIQKIPIAIEAYHERCKSYEKTTKTGITRLHHKPHGVVAVFGPFNFPGHLPNGHIVPALLAGNTVVLKPSDKTPLVAEKMLKLWEAVKLPKGVLNLVQGGNETGKTLVTHPGIQGLFFTGSYAVGSQISAQWGKTPEKILALEMGGNNPLVVHDIADQGIKAAVYHTIYSAYVTAGQRCTCARRLILTKSDTTKTFLETLKQAIQKLKIGPFWEQPEPFLGPVISREAADHIMDRYQALIQQGAKVLVAMKRDSAHPALLSPGLLDVTEVKNREDEEIFGPVLQLIWVEDFKAALLEANNTKYGLVAGILCDKKQDYATFYQEMKAGLIHWNRSTTGSSSHLPFGGVGRSGNHRPAAYYSADYCAYPVSSLEEMTLELPAQAVPGIVIY